MLEVPFKNKKESFFYVKNKLINPKKLIDELINIAKERSLIFKDEADYDEILVPIIGKYQCRIRISGYCRCDYDSVKYNNCVCDYCDDCNDCNFKTNLNRIRITVKTVNGTKLFNKQEFKNWLEKIIKYENPYKINALKAKKIADEYLKREEEFNKAINYVEDGLLKTLFFLKAALTKPDNNSLEYLVSVLDDLINVKKTNKKSND